MAEKKRKRLTSREFWEKYGEQFERTERHYREWLERSERRAAERQAARESQAKEDAA